MLQQSFGDTDWAFGDIIRGFHNIKWVFGGVDQTLGDMLFFLEESVI
ncbi:MAG: hypothetical protein FWG67_03100 [Defluviitaleaceae bacterium]|nr:hypothetical protein [Defluviitaleaceae bacterium]